MLPQRSILQQKAEKYKVANISKAPLGTRLTLYRETLSDMDIFFDTWDLSNLANKSMEVIVNDVLEIISGMREIQPKIPYGQVKSVDGILTNLRLARDNLQVAKGMIKNNSFYKQCRTARANITEALKFF